MKRLSIILLFSLSILTCLCACAQVDQEVNKGIVGRWETSVDDDSSPSNSDGIVSYSFNKNMSGKLIIHSNNERFSTPFTYLLSEKNIEIQFDSGTVWNFPYILDGDTLTLEQRNSPVSYQRVNK